MLEIHYHFIVETALPSKKAHRNKFNIIVKGTMMIPKETARTVKTTT